MQFARGSLLTAALVCAVWSPAQSACSAVTQASGESHCSVGSDPVSDAGCSAETGPAGNTACLYIGKYYGKQYATCATNEYVKLKTGNMYWCRDETAKYCYFHCMVEKHNLNSGNVTPDCSCEDSTGPTTTPYSGTTLSPYCYSLSGDSCAWYTDCLEKKITCGAETGYALAFGKKYCELYAAHYSKFSALTQQWVDAVRKCLQVALVPLMRHYNQQTCDVVKKTAIASHTRCYLSPGAGQPSICTVMRRNPLDIMKIFWTIKGSFVELDLIVAMGVWKSFGEVIKTCGVNLAQLTGTAVRDSVLYKGIVDLINSSRLKRSIVSDPGKIAVEFTSALSDSLGWKQLGIEWIPLTVNFTSTDSVSFEVLVGNQRVFDVNKNVSQALDLQAEMEKLKTKVRNGEVSFRVSDGQLYMTQLSECGNLDCTLLNSTVTAPVQPKGSSVTQGLSLLGLLSAVMTGAVLDRIAC